MTDATTHDIDSPPVEGSSSTVWAVSLAFWITLLIAVLMYAAVAVAPRLHAWMDVRHSYLTNAHQLQALEAEVDYLERVRDALKTDPEFLRRMTTASMANDPADAELIPVSGSLVFGSSDELQQRLPSVEPLVGVSVVRRLAADRTLRSGLLVSVSVLIVFAFTVLNGSGGRFVATVVWLAKGFVRAPLNRYRRSETSVEDEGSADALS